jgi:DNA-binding transcriptional LysR family regulator
MIGPVRAALTSLETTLAGRAAFDPASSERRFAVAFRDVLEATLLPPLMAAVTAAAPGVEITATRVERRTLEADLFSGRLDVAVDVLLPVSPELRHEQLMSEPLVVVARQEHPRVRDALSLETYLAEEHVQVSSRRRGPSLEDVELARRGLSRRIRLRCQQYATASRTVALTDLLATMPERYARMAASPYGHRLFPLPAEGPRLELHLYWHVSTDQDPACAWLRERLKGSL